MQWFRDRPVVWDAVLAAVLGAIALVGLLTVDAEDISSHRDADAVGVALTVAVFLGVAVRRRWPEPVAWFVTAATVPYWVLDYVDTGTTIGVLVAVYTLAAQVDRPRSLRSGIAICVVLVAVMITGVLSEQEDLPAIAVVGNVVVFATAWTVGDSVRSRRAYLAEVEARAEAAEREGERTAEKAVQDERVRIARELHDVVAHSVSVMVVQAGAARRVLDRDPARAAESLAAIESTGRNALDELRRLLGVLREDRAAASTVPQPTAGDLAALVEQSRRAGLDVDLAVEGTADAVPVGVGLTVYRVVQEALTNVVKHAGPAHVDVHVTYGESVDIEVADDGRGLCRDADLPSGGQGLIGMRERIELFGGELHVGPRPGGGFRVRACLPVAGSAAA